MVVVVVVKVVLVVAAVVVAAASVTEVPVGCVCVCVGGGVRWGEAITTSKTMESTSSQRRSTYEDCLPHPPPARSTCCRPQRSHGR